MMGYWDQERLHSAKPIIPKYHYSSIPIGAKPLSSGFKKPRIHIHVSGTSDDFLAYTVIKFKGKTGDTS
jgi:hypothetical protein